MNKVFFLVFNIVAGVGLLTLPYIKTANAEREIKLAKREYPQNYFSQPMDIPMRLTGNFGELRSNHFHTGIDCKTNGQENLNVYALADGFVSRVAVSPRGYGNALYIDYPNGFTSVYAHINSFSGEIGDYVKRKQYELQKFEIDEKIPPSLLPVTKGQLVAKSGNTGSSNGPHLHFEMRDTETEIAINPLLFGFHVPDDIKPTITQLAIYGFKGETSGYQSPKLYATKLQNGNYVTAQNLLKVNHPRVGLGIKTQDKKNELYNINNVYGLKMYDNGNLLYAFEMEQIGFSESRYINAHIDYMLKKQEKGLVQKCFVEPANKLSIYQQAINNGIINLSDGLLHKIVIEVNDFNNNISTVSIMLQYDPLQPLSPVTEAPYNAQFSCFTDNSYQNDFLKLHLPSGCLYNDLFFQYDMKPATQTDIYSSLHQIHLNEVPIHSYCDIAIKPTTLPFELYDYALLVFKNNTGKVTPLKSRWEGNFLTGQTREFGQFYITTDVKKPTITAVNIVPGKLMTKNKSIQLKISDNLSGIDSFNGYIDNRWVLMEYDQKSARIWHTFDEITGAPGTHEFKLVVRDAKYNTAEFVAKFKR